MNDDLFSIFALRCCKAAECGETVSVKLSTLDNPGWSLRIRNVEALANRRVADVDSRRSRHDWVRIQTDSGVLTAMGGPLNLNEMLWHLVGGQSSPREAGHDGVPPVPLYWHRQGWGPLDLAIRLQHQFLGLCDYDWEHGYGIDLLTLEDGNWAMRVDLDRPEPLTVLDLAAARVMLDSDSPIRFESQASRMIARAPVSHLVEMVARVVEWLEGDWREHVENRRFFPPTNSAN